MFEEDCLKILLKNQSRFKIGITNTFASATHNKEHKYLLAELQYRVLIFSIWIAPFRSVYEKKLPAGTSGISDTSRFQESFTT